MCIRKLFFAVLDFLFSTLLGKAVATVAVMGFIIWLFIPTPPGEVKDKSVGSLVTAEQGVKMEKIYDEGTWEVYRLWVPKGWVVFAPRGNNFVPDPNHEWELNETTRH